MRATYGVLLNRTCDAKLTLRVLHAHRCALKDAYFSSTPNDELEKTVVYQVIASHVFQNF